MTKKELRGIMNDFDNGYWNINDYNYIVIDKKTKQILENCIDYNTAMDFINNAIMWDNLNENDFMIYNLNDYEDNDSLDIIWG